MNGIRTRFKASDPRITKHGMASTPIYKRWHAMKERCSDKAKGKTRKTYYERGIRVCERWSRFDNFIADMGMPPNASASIDRIDNDGDYTPSNCRWATRKQQANNTSANRIIEFNGESRTISEWALVIGIKPNTLQYRIKRGIPLNRALVAEMPKGARAKQKLERERTCMECGKTFLPRVAQIRAGRGKFCSHKCQGTYKAHARLALAGKLTLTR